MAGSVIYLCHPRDLYVPGIRACVEAAMEEIGVRPGWGQWSVRTLEYDASASLRVADLCSQVLGKVGPVVLLEPVQGKVFELLKQRLDTRTTILKGGATSTQDVMAFLTQAREIHESGEPHICRKFVVALLLLRKLDQERMWGGNAKGYMWAADIPKGRGLDEQFSDAVPPVLSLLLQQALLIKKTSQSTSKYALNPDRREEIYGILRDRQFPDARLTEILHRDVRVVSARALDLLDRYLRPPDRGGKH